MTVMNTVTVFEGEILDRKDEILSLCAEGLNKESFITTAIVAVKHNPDLLQADRRGLHIAVNNAARDGLMPDGKEGVILIRNTKVTVGNKKEWIKLPVWQPMVFGIRKRARELEDIIINAEVVFENDEFIWRKGDDPGIEHIPAKLGTDPGKMIGAYAIFKKDAGTILHREVMDAGQIGAVKSISKQPDGLMWKEFATEAWKKSVVHRGAKTVPFCENLRTIINRHEDMFDITPEEKPAVDEIPFDIPGPPQGEDVDQSADGTIRELEKRLDAAGGDIAIINAIQAEFSEALMSMNEDDRGTATDMIEASKPNQQVSE